MPYAPRIERLDMAEAEYNSTAVSSSDWRKDVEELRNIVSGNGGALHQGIHFTVTWQPGAIPGPEELMITAGYLHRVNSQALGRLPRP